MRYFRGVLAVSTTHLHHEKFFRLNSCNIQPFSHQNNIHSRVRNRLTREKVDELAFSYYDSRALDRSLAMPWDSDCETATGN